jgi:hypothetical protein
VQARRRDGVQCRGVLPALDLADVVAAELGKIAEPFLRQPRFLAQLADDRRV